MKKSFVIPDNYPFIDDILEQARKIKRTVRRIATNDPNKTILEETQYVPIGFVKVFQNAELLDRLSPYACKMFMYICCELEYCAIDVRLALSDSGMSKPTFYKALTELTMARIIRKVEQRKEWYWVNVSLISVGNVHKKTESE